jgi:hypothetical protein
MAQKFLTDIEVTQGLIDSSGDLGVAGQVLSSTGSGTNWITNEANSTVVYLDEFTGDNSTVDFTISVSVTDENITQVYIDGVYQNKDTYSVSGTTLTFSTAPPLNADIEVITFSTATTSDDLAAGSVIIPVKNTHTASIAKGEPVYITGNVGASARLEIAPADASNSAKMPAAGLLLQTLAVNAEGYVITGGYLRNITTDTIDGTSTTSNDTVYVKSGGGLTMTKPTGTNLIQNIAKVARSSGGSSGSLLVSSILRTNDVPNITNDYFWLGNSSGVATPTEFTSTARGLLSIGAEATAAGDGNLAYNNSSGVFTYTPPVLGGLSGTTDNITEGSTNLYYTDARARSAISVSGNAISYNSSTGVITSNYEESPSFTGNATFGGTISGSGIELSNYMQIKVDDAEIYWTNAANNDYWRWKRDASNNFICDHYNGSSTTAALSFSSSQNATFAGNVTVGNNGNINIPTASSGNANLNFDGTDFKITSNSSSANLKLETNSTTRLTIDSSGDVGIGVTSPGHVLDVSGNIRLQGGNRKLIYNNGSVETSLDQVSGSTAGLFTLGNVAIGAISPQAQLHINEDTSNSYATLRLEGANRGGIIEMYNQTSYPVSSWTTDQSGNIFFATSGAFAATSLSTKFTILTGGNVGIGTTSPTNGKLEVQQTATTAALLAQTGGTTSSYTIADFRTGTNLSALALKGNGTALFNGLVEMAGGGAVYQAQKFWLDGGGDTFLESPSSNLMTFTTGGTERMRIDSSGNVNVESGRIRIAGGGSDSGTQLNLWSDTNGYCFIAGYQTIFNQGNNNSRSEVMRITSTGLGIGTTSPSAKLEVNGALFVGNHTGTVTPTSGIFIEEASGVDTQIQMYTYGGSVFRIKGSEIKADIGWGSSQNRSVNFNNTGTGNISVGIGTASPSEILHLNKTSGTGCFIRFQNTGGSGVYIGGRSEVMEMYTNGSEKMRITSAGNVGIGETSPAEKLEVNGNIKAGDTTGKFFTNVYTATTASFADTFSSSGAGLWEYIIRINPNPGGSGSYVDFYYGKVGVGSGWNGSNVTDYIWYQEDQTAPRTLYPSGGGNKTISWVMVSGGSEVTNVSGGATVTIRVKGFGGNSYNQNVNIFLRRLA